MPRNFPANSSRQNQPAQELQDINFVDCNALLEATEAVAAAERIDRVQFSYPALKNVLRSFRSGDWRRSQLDIALVSADRSSEGQQRFAAMLDREGFEADVSYYRDNFVSLPPGRQPADLFDPEKKQRPLISLATRISYSLGLLARHPAPQVLVVSHSFEMYWPMLNFVERNPAARVGLVFFGSLLDYRWKHTGVLDSDSPVKFFNLDAHSADLLGGVDLTGNTVRATPRAATSTGLNRL